MGKGATWINGHSIGRYWAHFSAQIVGCPACGYKGNYAAWKCTTNCGASSQQWYHVPRSFFTTDHNVSTLFEEFGGNPAEVSFHTVTVGTACASIPEGKTLELPGIEGRTFSEIQFASYGDATGSYGSFSEVTCGCCCYCSEVKGTPTTATTCKILCRSILCTEKGPWIGHGIGYKIDSFMHTCLEKWPASIHSSAFSHYLRA